MRHTHRCVHDILRASPNFQYGLHSRHLTPWLSSTPSIGVHCRREFEMPPAAALRPGPTPLETACKSIQRREGRMRADFEEMDVRGVSMMEAMIKAVDELKTG